jgi:hypothetical protein
VHWRRFFVPVTVASVVASCQDRIREKFENDLSRGVGHSIAAVKLSEQSAAMEERLTYRAEEYFAPSTG